MTAPQSKYPSLRDSEIKSDPGLRAHQRETIIRFNDAEDVATVYSENLSVMRSLRKHPKYNLNELRVTDENRFGVRIFPGDFEDDGLITGMEGHMPIGCIKISYPGRADNYPSGVVSNTVDDLSKG